MIPTNLKRENIDTFAGYKILCNVAVIIRSAYYWIYWCYENVFYIIMKTIGKSVQLSSNIFQHDTRIYKGPDCCKSTCIHF